MRINQVVIVPTLKKEQGLGRFADGLFERQVLYSYIDAMIERMDEDRVTFMIEEDENQIIPNSLILVCGIGWQTNAKSSESNFSKISYAQTTSRKACELINEALSEWGKSYADYHHKPKEISNAKDTILRRKDTLAVKIEPFQMNGPSSASYARNLETLGDMLAQSIVEFLSCREELPQLPSMYK